MPRRGIIKKKKIHPDPFYNSTLIAKFMNLFLKKGKKSVAERGFAYAQAEGGLLHIDDLAGKDFAPAHRLPQKLIDLFLQRFEVEQRFRLHAVFPSGRIFFAPPAPLNYRTPAV